MKRFLYEAMVKSAQGTQVFYIDANTQEEADARAEKDDTDGMYQHEVEVQGLYELQPIGETDLADFGDFPPTQLSGDSGELPSAERTPNERNLVMAISRIVSSSRRHLDPTLHPAKRAEEAWDLVLRLGLEGSPLRDADHPSDSQAEPSDTEVTNDNPR